MWYYELIGYIGMAFVLCSFLMRDIKWLRILNLVGGVLCCVYGFITQTYATAFLNLCLVIINFSSPFVYIIRKKHKPKNTQEDKVE